MKKFITIFAIILSTVINAQCFQKVSVGYEHTIVIMADGTLWGWGANDAGELGTGSITAHYYVPIQIGTANDWVKVFAGTGNTSFAIKANGTLWAWGDNASSTLGFNSPSTIYIPTQLGTSTDWDFVASGSGAIAKKTDGTLWGQGSNVYGQLNLGVASIQLTPVQISTQTDWNKIACGDNHVLLIKNNGTLWAAGLNDFGQLGDGTRTNKFNFVQIGTDNDWTEIAAEFKHSVAIKTNGTIWGWGSNVSNVLGFPSTTSNVRVPTQIGTDTNWFKVDTGYYTTNAIKTDGTLWYNNSTGFHQLQTDTDWNFIDSGQAYIFVMKTNGTLWGVGGNDYGQLGIGQVIQGTQVPIQLNCSAFLGVEEINAFNKISIYPNPTNEILFIENSSNSIIKKITLTDITGKLVLEEAILFSKINMQSFQNGIYILSVTSENKIYKYKIVKQ